MESSRAQRAPPSARDLFLPSPSRLAEKPTMVSVKASAVERWARSVLPQNLCYQWTAGRKVSYVERKMDIAELVYIMHVGDLESDERVVCICRQKGLCLTPSHLAKRKRSGKGRPAKKGRIAGAMALQRVSWMQWMVPEKEKNQARVLQQEAISGGLFSAAPEQAPNESECASARTRTSNLRPKEQSVPEHAESHREVTSLTVLGEWCPQDKRPWAWARFSPSNPTTSAREAIRTTDLGERKAVWRNVKQRGHKDRPTLSGTELADWAGTTRGADKVDRKRRRASGFEQEGVLRCSMPDPGEGMKRVEDATTTNMKIMNETRARVSASNENAIWETKSKKRCLRWNASRAGNMLNDVTRDVDLASIDDARHMGLVEGVVSFKIAPLVESDRARGERLRRQRLHRLRRGPYLPPSVERLRQEESRN